ncbi:MAG: hypothetical protein QM529_00875 [Hydrotalea sp.]|nr:hypothetical protein [Hydrotalea sp.]
MKKTLYRIIPKLKEGEKSYDIFARNLRQHREMNDPNAKHGDVDGNEYNRQIKIFQDIYFGYMFFTDFYMPAAENKVVTKEIIDKNCHEAFIAVLFFYDYDNENNKIIPRFATEEEMIYELNKSFEAKLTKKYLEYKINIEKQFYKNIFKFLSANRDHIDYELSINLKIFQILLEKLYVSSYHDNGDAWKEKIKEIDKTKYIIQEAELSLTDDANIEDGLIIANLNNDFHIWIKKIKYYETIDEYISIIKDYFFKYVKYNLSSVPLDDINKTQNEIIGPIKKPLGLPTDKLLPDEILKSKYANNFRASLFFLLMPSFIKHKKYASEDEVRFSIILKEDIRITCHEILKRLLPINTLSERLETLHMDMQTKTTTHKFNIHESWSHLIKVSII